MTVSKRIVLHFPQRITNRPIVSRLVKDYNFGFNILKALRHSGTRGIAGLRVKRRKG